MTTGERQYTLPVFKVTSWTEDDLDEWSTSSVSNRSDEADIPYFPDFHIEVEGYSDFDRTSQNSQTLPARLPDEHKLSTLGRLGKVARTDRIRKYWSLIG